MAMAPRRTILIIGLANFHADSSPCFNLCWVKIRMKAVPKLPKRTVLMKVGTE
jgi:hypothetical protein